MKTEIKQIFAMIGKDIRLEIRNLSDLFSILLFNLVSILIFSNAYSFGTNSTQMPLTVFVIQIWIILFFSMIFIMSKIFQQESKSNCLEGLLVSPFSPISLIFSKIFFSLILLCIIDILVFSFGTLFSNPLNFNLSFLQAVRYLCVGLFVPTLNLSVSGTLISIFGLYVKNKPYFYPILLFPMILPLVSPIISLNLGLLEGLLIQDLLYEILFILAHSILFLSLGILLSKELFNLA